MSYSSSVSIRDSSNLDAFSRLRVSEVASLHESQFTYNLIPLRFEQIVSGSGASITHDATNRCATMTFSSTPTSNKAYMQTFEYFQYQPGRSQLAYLTFNFIASVSGATKFAGISDGVNGVELQQVGGGVTQIVLYSGTSNGNQTVAQSSWNLDKLDGTGPSGITLDLTKVQILVIDYQALYTGRVRVGFDVGGIITYAHEFKHANVITTPYIQYASLPIRCGMVSTGTVSTTMRFICSAVLSEGGTSDLAGVSNSVSASLTAGNGTDTHVLSVRPKTTFNSITNRSNMALYSLAAVVTGANPVFYKIVIGQAITGTTTFSDVNTNYSAYEFNTAGTISGAPALVLESGYVSSSASSKGYTGNKLLYKTPITLDSSGAVRANGTISIIAQGLTGTSACQFALNWKELR